MCGKNIELGAAMQTSLQMQNIKLSSDRKAIVILDQTRLPNHVEYVTLQSPQEVFEAIQRLKVRGAPAIGICAGYAMFCLAQQIQENSYEAFAKRFGELGRYLNSSRPTAVNLSWAIGRMEKVVQANGDKSIPEIIGRLEEESRAIHDEDMRMCLAISEYGLSLIKHAEGVLTHCNAGPLATSRYGTALGPLLLAQERGMHIRVFADETRPLLQGARLTAYELFHAGVDVTLICDNMASIVMQNGWVQACLVGCDRVAANGDVANKIGTSGVAILAKHYGIPFYVLAPPPPSTLRAKRGMTFKSSFATRRRSSGCSSLSHRRFRM